MALLLLLFCDDFGKASSEFRAALQASNDARLEKAIVEVVRDNSERAAKLLISGLATNNTRFYWLIITGISRFLSKEAVGEVERVILSKSPPGALRRDLMMALQLSTAGPADAAILRIAAEGTPDLQLVAIDEIVKRGLKDGIPVLIEVVKKDEKKGTELHRQALKALVNLTGQSLSGADSWQAWWDRSKDTFKIGEAPKASGGTVVETIKRNRTTDYEDLQKGKKEEIVVVSGAFDEVQKVLEKLSIPHTVITKDDFDKHDFSKCIVLLVNCDDYMSKRFTKRQQEAVRNWVAQGGYLFTSDWGLVDLLEDAFPGYVKKAGEIPPRMNVDILPKKGSTGHPFLKEVFIKVKSDGGKDGKSASQIEEKIDHRWEIDELSYTIGYDPNKVVVLCESPELLGTTKDNAVAVTFAFGDLGGGKPAVASGGVYEELPKMRAGKVLHILSHFGKQKNAQDDYALQNMLLNFLIEAKDRKRLAVAKKK